MVLSENIKPPSHAVVEHNTENKFDFVFYVLCVSHSHSRIHT